MSGVATVEGGTWVRQSTDRPQIWEIHVNGVLISQGRLFTGDGFTETTPFAFSAGSGGASAMTFSVSPSDIIELRLIKDTPDPPGSGDIVGVDIEITVES